MGLQNAIEFGEKEGLLRRQGHSRSPESVLIESPFATSY